MNLDALIDKAHPPWLLSDSSEPIRGRWLDAGEVDFGVAPRPLSLMNAVLEFTMKDASLATIELATGMYTGMYVHPGDSVSVKYQTTIG